MANSQEILMTSQAYHDMVTHAKEGVPLEVCGYGVGKDNVVTKVIRMNNISATPEIYFNFDINEMFKVQKECRAEGLRFLIVYHSHPRGGSEPSASDKKELRDPNLRYIIISLANQQVDVNGFWIQNQEAEKINIKIIEKN